MTTLKVAGWVVAAVVALAVWQPAGWVVAFAAVCALNADQ